MRLPILLVLAALGGVLLLGACGGDDGGEAKNGGGGAAAGAAYPVTVTDLLGRSVEIAAKPVTVVGLSPTAVELVYAAGGTVAGRSSSVTYPEAAKQAADIGSAYQPTIEAVLALHPDLIVADSIIHAQPQLRGSLEALDVPVIFAGADSYDRVIEGLRLMGRVFDAKEKTDGVIAEIETALKEARDTVAGTSVTAVLMIADRDQTLYAAKATSYAGDILAKVGVENPAANEPDVGPFPGYSALAPEKLLQLDPDFILAVTPAPEPAPRLSTIIPQIPPFRGLAAVRNDRVVEMNVEFFLQAPGPRIAGAFRALAAAVTAE